MAGNVISFLVGVVCVVLGISNMQGNINSLHSYHRHRVSDEDRLPFGKKVGLGMVLIGCAVMLFSILAAAATILDQQIYLWIGFGVLIAGFLVGMVITFRAMIRYNGGIF